MPQSVKEREGGSPCAGLQLLLLVVLCVYVDVVCLALAVAVVFRNIQHFLNFFLLC
jgi:hypothetical protein